MDIMKGNENEEIRYTMISYMMMMMKMMMRICAKLNLFFVCVCTTNFRNSLQWKKIFKYEKQSIFFHLKSVDFFFWKIPF